jgi:hypothetical protein
MVCFQFLLSYGIEECYAVFHNDILKIIMDRLNLLGDPLNAKKELAFFMTYQNELKSIFENTNDSKQSIVTMYINDCFSEATKDNYYYDNVKTSLSYNQKNNNFNFHFVGDFTFESLNYHWNDWISREMLFNYGLSFIHEIQKHFPKYKTNHEFEDKDYIYFQIEKNCVVRGVNHLNQLIEASIKNDKKMHEIYRKNYDDYYNESMEMMKESIEEDNLRTFQLSG